MNGNRSSTLVRYDNHADGLTICEQGFITFCSEIPFMEELIKFCKERDIEINVVMVRRKVFDGNNKILDKHIWDTYTIEDFENRVAKCQ